MDVLCVGMYRACSTWQYDVAAHLVERYHGGQRLGFVQGSEYKPPAAPLASVWRVLKSHEGGPAFRRALEAGQAIGLYAYRDARDVVYSMLHKRGQDFDSFLRQGMVHQILANDAYWTGFAPGRLLIQRYESLMADPARGVREIAAHCHIALTHNNAAEIAERYSFQANRARADAAAERLRASGLDLGDPANQICFDPHSLLHWNHLRDGRSGGWRERATPRERAILAHILGPWLASRGYQADPQAPAITGRDRIAVARGWLACQARCASLRFPVLSTRVKRALGVPTAYQAKPIAEPAAADTLPPARSDAA